MFNTLITDRRKDPLGKLLLDYNSDYRDRAIIVESPHFEIWTMTAKKMFRSYEEMSELEQTALALCSGKILDAGAGSGCHTLYLQSRGLQVDAIDISPGCVEVMQQRGVSCCSHANIFGFSRRKFDTLLMLMNGFGICGTLDGLNLFLQLSRELLADDGQILADSTDFTHNLQLDVPTFNEEYPGETEFIMRYGKCESDPFPWVYIDFATLQTLTNMHDLVCQCIMMMEDGRYLARISLQ